MQNNNELERNSYMANALERLEQENGNRKEEQISKEEMLELCMFALFVGVDTTGYVHCPKDYTVHRSIIIHLELADLLTHLRTSFALFWFLFAFITYWDFFLTVL
jgi:hypothetical protein